MNKLGNYITGKWITGDGDGQLLYNAVTADVIAAASTKGLDFKSIAEYARAEGNPALRKMTFHARGNMLKALVEKKLTVISSEIEWIPANTIELNEEQSEEVFKLIERLEGDDDVQHVFHNMA